MAGFIYGGYVAGGFIAGAGVFAQTLRTATAGDTPLARWLSTSGGPITLSRDLIAQSSLVLPDWKGTSRVNILLLGLDQREEEEQLGIASRTDSVIVVSIDPVAKAATMISFPRDLWIDIPGQGEHRINEAFALGEAYRVEGGGPALLARTIELNFGLSTPYYAVVNFHAFETAVDTLGGIPIDVPRPVRDDQYPTDDYGIERIYVAIGPQLMDGGLALKYARTRHGDNDLFRTARQQQVLLAMRERALRPETFSRLPSLVEQGMRTVTTNFSGAELLALAKLASQMDRADLTTLVIQQPLVADYRLANGTDVLLPRKDDIRAVIRKTLGSATPTPTPAPLPNPPRTSAPSSGPSSSPVGTIPRTNAPAATTVP